MSARVPQQHLAFARITVTPVRFPEVRVSVLGWGINLEPHGLMGGGSRAFESMTTLQGGTP